MKNKIKVYKALLQARDCLNEDITIQMDELFQDGATDAEILASRRYIVGQKRKKIIIDGMINEYAIIHKDTESITIGEMYYNGILDEIGDDIIIDGNSRMGHHHPGWYNDFNSLCYAIAYEEPDDPIDELVKNYTGFDITTDQGYELTTTISDDGAESVAKAREIIASEKWKSRTMTGYSQSEWNDVFYNIKEESYIQELESLYMGKYVEIYADDAATLKYDYQDDANIDKIYADAFGIDVNKCIYAGELEESRC